MKTEPNNMPYHGTHPWLKFKVDLRNLPISAWIQLGECAARCDQMSGIPLKPFVRENLHLIYLAKGIRATTAIEGNTLSEKDVREIIEKEAQTPLSKEYLEQEIKNVLMAYNQISEHIRGNVDVAISPQKICEYNSIILNNLPIEEGIEPGKFRQYRVSVGKYLAPEPKDVQLLMEKLCTWLSGDEFKPSRGINPLVLAILKAVIAHVYIAWIHPFGDGNGRTARLIEFKILAQSGMPLPATHILSDFYNTTRVEYYNQLEKSSKSDGKIDNFISYAVQGFLDGLNKQFDLIRSQQIEVAMENYIHEQFRDRPGEIWRRRRHLALDLLSKGAPVKKDEIVLISKRINSAYKSISDRALTRDLKIIHEMGLIISSEGAFSINMAPILGFLPIRKGGL